MYVENREEDKACKIHGKEKKRKRFEEGKQENVNVNIPLDFHQVYFTLPIFTISNQSKPNQTKPNSKLSFPYFCILYSTLIHLFRQSESHASSVDIHIRIFFCKYPCNSFVLFYNTFVLFCILLDFL